jgi:hypothetical protein
MPQHMRALLAALQLTCPINDAAVATDAATIFLPIASTNSLCKA